MVSGAVRLQSFIVNTKGRLSFSRLLFLQLNLLFERFEAIVRLIPLLVKATYFAFLDRFCTVDFDVLLNIGAFDLRAVSRFIEALERAREFLELAILQMSQSLVVI